MLINPFGLQRIDLFFVRFPISFINRSARFVVQGTCRLSVIASIAAVNKYFLFLFRNSADCSHSLSSSFAINLLIPLSAQRILHSKRALSFSTKYFFVEF